MNEGLNNCFQTDRPDTYIWARPNEDGVRPLASYANHSCQPNCYIDIKDGVIWIRAARTIRRGEEITYHYNTDGEGLIMCRCRPGCQTLL